MGIKEGKPIKMVYDTSKMPKSSVGDCWKEANLKGIKVHDWPNVTGVETTDLTNKLKGFRERKGKILKKTEHWFYTHEQSTFAYEFLTKLGRAFLQYERCLDHQGIKNAGDLLDYDHKSLEQIGIKNLAHRKRILKLAAKLDKQDG